MSIPSSVSTLLNDWHISYRLADEEDTLQLLQIPGDTALSARTAITILLQDQTSHIQAIIPGNRLLDLNRLEQEFYRSFTAATADKLEHLKQSLGVIELPALPHLTGLDTLIDSNLLEQDELLLASGNEGEWLTVSTDDFRKLASSSHIGCYTAPLATDVHHTPAQDLHDVQSAVRQFTPLRIQQRLGDTLELPPLPESAREIINLRTDPTADTKELAQLVENDPVLAAQIVSWARSPYYSAQDIKNVEEAVLRVLGFDLTMNMVLGLALGRIIDMPKEGPDGYQSFWQQALLTATLCSQLARRLPPEERLPSGTAYLCGLLHNFGFLIMSHIFPPQFTLVNQYVAANPHIERFYIERHLLGMTREQISSCLMQQWGMPEEVVIALRHQHHPEYHGEHHDYAHLLHLAKHSLRRQGICHNTGRINPTMFNTHILKIEDIDDVTTSLLNNLDELNRLANMMC